MFKLSGTNTLLTVTNQRPGTVMLACSSADWHHICSCSQQVWFMGRQRGERPCRISWVLRAEDLCFLRLDQAALHQILPRSCWQHHEPITSKQSHRLPATQLSWKFREASHIMKLLLGTAYYSAGLSQALPRNSRGMDCSGSLKG